VIAAFHSIIDSDDFPKPARILLDLRKAGSVLKRSISDLKRIAATFVEHSCLFDNRVALLVDGLARYGLMRMAAAWVERDGVSAAVFRDPDEARRWTLQMPTPQPNPSPQ
jgi:hypothetical protein